MQEFKGQKSSSKVKTPRPEEKSWRRREPRKRNKGKREGQVSVTGGQGKA